ncbi:type II toxin-antitoxin system RelE/ParE family toxin [Sphaerisporangium rufum]|nr:type II toxin-antitoxin system RelE/ParE family toxin [Sphaerisporangium rufum]
MRRSDRDTFDVLSSRGPSLGRPLVDTVRHSNLSNLKELRPGSQGATEVRILFAFDPSRRAIFLIGGDKSSNWQGWYNRAIPVAEDRYREHLKRAEGDREGERRH